MRLPSSLYTPSNISQLLSNTMELSQYTEAQSEKYHFHSGTGDLDAFLCKVSRLAFPN